MGKFNKSWKRIAMLCMATISLFSTFTFVGCGGETGDGGGNNNTGTGDVYEEEEINTNKSQLYISNYNGGGGTQWLYNIKKRFEEDYKNVCFEPGTDKKGVQLIISPNTNSATSMTTSFATATDDVFFLEDLPYYDWVKRGYFADISDIYDKPATEGEEKLEDKLTKEQKENLTVIDGKYYALPHYETFRGISYDVDLFEKKNLYINKSHSGFVTSKSQPRSNGPDNKTGVINGVDYSLDDGLPATYEEFFKLMDQMVKKNVTPFIWNGRDSCGYLDYVLEAALNAYSTKVEAELPLTFNTGNKTARVITGFNGTTPIIEEKKVTEDTGYLALQQSGRYYALNLLKKMTSNKKYYYSDSTKTTFTHRDAQEQFLYSSLQNEPIGMIVDGSWWLNEAKLSGAYDRSVSDYGAKAENRNFAWMPLPNKWDSSDKGNDDFVMKDALRCYSFIHSKVERDPNKLKLAKTFLKYCYTDAELQQYTVDTGMARAMQYDLTEDQLAQLNSYSRTLFQYRNRATVIYNLSDSNIYMNNETRFIKQIWQAKVGGEQYINAYLAYKDGVTPVDYFKGLWYTSSAWNTAYRQFYTTGD